jgi:4-hydroxy-2-oxoheptanedioate aldolase
MAGYLQQPHFHVKAPFRAALLSYPGNMKKALRLASEDQAHSLFGLATGVPSVFFTKVLASTRPDFIFVDVEHGMFNRLELHELDPCSHLRPHELIWCTLVSYMR